MGARSPGSCSTPWSAIWTAGFRRPAHLHVLVLDGAYIETEDDGLEFIDDPGLPADLNAIEAEVLRRFERWLRRHGYLDDEPVAAERDDAWWLAAACAPSGVDADGRVCSACAGALKPVGAILHPHAATWIGTRRIYPVGALAPPNAQLPLTLPTRADPQPLRPPPLAERRGCRPSPSLAQTTTSARLRRRSSEPAGGESGPRAAFQGLKAPGLPAEALDWGEGHLETGLGFPIGPSPARRRSSRPWSPARAPIA